MKLIQRLGKFSFLLLIWPVFSWAAPEVGSVAIYSNGQVERLMQKSPDFKVWEDGRKRRYKRSIYPFMPVLEYSKFPLVNGSYRQTLSKGKPDRLAPYGSEERVHLTVNRINAEGVVKERNWRCDNQGSSTFDYLGESLSTQLFECIRFTLPKWKVKERLTLAYASEIDLVVDFTREKSGKTKRVQLILLLAPEEASVSKIAAEVKRLKTQSK